MRSVRPPPARPARFKNPDSILWIEAAGFSLLLVLCWLSEIFDVPQLFFSDPAAFTWARPLARSAIVIVVWLCVHLATRRLLKRLRYLEGFLRVCSWCRKIGHQGTWITTEEFFGSALATDTSHGICPECAKNLFAAPTARRGEHPVSSSWRLFHMDKKPPVDERPGT